MRPSNCGQVIIAFPRLVVRPVVTCPCSLSVSLPWSLPPSDIQSFWYR